MRMFMSALFIIAKNWKQSTCQRRKWANKIMKYHTAIKIIIWKAVKTWTCL